MERKIRKSFIQGNYQLGSIDFIERLLYIRCFKHGKLTKLGYGE